MADITATPFGAAEHCALDNWAAEYAKKLFVTEAASRTADIANEAAERKTAIASVRNDFTAADEQLASAYKAADSEITAAYTAADQTLRTGFTTLIEKVNSSLTDSYEAADRNLYNSLTSNYKEADSTLKSDVTTAYKAADDTLQSNITTAYKAAISSAQDTVYSKMLTWVTNDINYGGQLGRVADGTLTLTLPTPKQLYIWTATEDCSKIAVANMMIDGKPCSGTRKAKLHKGCTYIFKTNYMADLTGAAETNLISVVGELAPMSETADFIKIVSPDQIKYMPTSTCPVVFLFDEWYYDDESSNIYAMTFDIQTGRRYVAFEDSEFNLSEAHEWENAENPYRNYGGSSYTGGMMQDTEIRCGELKTLKPTLPAGIPPEDYEGSIVFTSGETATEVTIPDEVKLSGTDVWDGVFTPQKNTRYTIALWYDGRYMNGVIRGVDL